METKKWCTKCNLSYITEDEYCEKCGNKLSVNKPKINNKNYFLLAFQGLLIIVFLVIFAIACNLPTTETVFDNYLLIIMSLVLGLFLFTVSINFVLFAQFKHTDILLNEILEKISNK